MVHYLTGEPYEWFVMSYSCAICNIHLGTFALHFLFDVVLVYIIMRLWPGSRLSIALTWIICGVSFQ